jgi:hypothetical protein
MPTGLDPTPAGNAPAHGNHRAPLGKTGAHLKIIFQEVTLSIQTFGYLLSEMPCNVLCTGINFDAGYDSRVGDGFNERSAIFHLLADRPVIGDDATSALTATGG